MSSGPHAEFVASIGRFIKAREVFADYFAFHVAEQLRVSGVNSVSLSKRFEQGNLDAAILDAGTKRVSICNIMLEKIPIPADDVPFERILEFRSDEEARGYLYGLRH